MTTNKQFFEGPGVSFGCIGAILLISVATLLVYLLMNPPVRSLSDGIAPTTNAPVVIPDNDNIKIGVAVEYAIPSRVLCDTASHRAISVYDWHDATGTGNARVGFGYAVGVVESEAFYQANCVN